jgi:hypothetical protein
MGQFRLKKIRVYSIFSKSKEYEINLQIEQKTQMKKILLIVLLSVRGFSQEKAPQTTPIKPTPVEFIFGHKRIQGQSIIIKNFSKSKFGIFSLTTLAGDYKNVDKTNNELFSNFQLNYDIYKGIKLTSGATFSSAKGFAPIAGLEYVFVNKKFTIVFNPTIELNKSSALANFGQVEYAPKNDKLNPYFRLQGLYIQSLADQHHVRSSIVSRAGISKKSFSTGLGFNQDFYGQTKISKSNFGVFFQYKFI